MKCENCDITKLERDFYKNFYDWTKKHYKHIVENWDNEYVK